MQKTLLYLAILAILGFGVWFFLFSEKSGELFRSSDAAFTVRDTGAIGKIFLSANNSPEPLTAERKEAGWIINGKYPASQSRIRQILATLSLQEALYPVPDNQREGTLRGLAGGGIKVEVYDRSGRKMRSFYVGGEMGGFTGTGMLMAGSETPYVVQIPGFEGYLTTRYLTSLNLWRDQLVFDIAPEQIEAVSIRYPLEPLSSFTLTQQGGKVAVALDTALHLDRPLNEARAKSYLGLFSQVYAESFASGTPALDSIVRSMPQKALMDVRGANGYHKTATIIYFPITERSKNVGSYTPTNFDEHYNLDRYFAVINNGADTMTVQIPSFGKFFRRGYEFFAQDGAPPVNAVPGLPNGLGTH